MSKPSLAALFARLSKRERLILYVTAGLAVVALIYWVVLSPILSKMSQLDDQIKAQEVSIKKSLVILSSEEQINADRERYLSMSGDMGSDEQDVTAFLKDIENLAKEASVYLVDIKPAGQSKTGEYFLELNFEGQMEQVFSFFYGISHSEKLIKIMRYQIRPKAEGGSVVSCNLAVMKLIVPK